MQESVASPISHGSEAEHEAAVNEVRKSYVVPPDSSVIDFLNRHRSIPQVLLQASERLRELFGSGRVFSLRALERFDDSWWIANSRQAAGNLTFTYELV